MRRNAPVFALAGVAIAAAAWTLVPAKTDVPTHANLAPAISSGYIVHLDGSGKVVTDPQAIAVADAQFNAELAKQFNTSSAGLQQVNVPGFGVKVDLQGRFQCASVATVDANGKVVVPCLTNENDVKAFEKTRAAATAARKE